MKKSGFLFLATAMLFMIPDRAKGQCSELVWADEFNTEGLPDSTRWSYDIGGGGWGNNELQYYTDRRLKNARVENGKLIIDAHNESYLGSTYTSARLVSKLKGDWLYGTVEVRAKLPVGLGTWAAIWMLPTDWEYGSWPSSGEIDIMEYVGYDTNKVYGTIHTEAFNHSLGTQKGSSVTLTDAADTFHVYKTSWTPEAIELYVDDTKYYTFNNLHTGYTTWPFDKRFHLVLNLAVGGSWGGSQGVDPTAFPARMEIDYARVYQSSDKLTIHGPPKAFPLQEDLHFFLYHDQEASYSWSLKGDGEITSPADSSEVYVRWGCSSDTLLCHVSTSCGEYDLAYPVGIDDYIIYGPVFVGSFQDNVLLRTPLLFGSSFTWTVPSGVTITNGQGNDSLTVTWGESSGSVLLSIENTCGTYNISRKLRLYGQYAYPDPDVPHPIPGIINATAFDYGGEGVAYHDAETANQGSGPRGDEGVDTEYNDNGTTNVGWISDGEWLEYTIRVSRDDYYQAGFRIASNNATRGPLRIIINGEERIPDIDIPFTGSWSTFTTLIANDIPFYTTDTIMRLYAVTGGFNIGNIIIDTTIPDAVKEIRPEKITVYPNPVNNTVYIKNDGRIQKIVLCDMAGKTLQVEDHLCKQPEDIALDLQNYRPGLYFLRIIKADYETEIVKIVHW
ncbi:MAG: family 16 glycosylhydrolase [Bacteroidales bacterium]|nr:family 16 glycosylhydrolase [Bacteroidales bacterium]